MPSKGAGRGREALSKGWEGLRWDGWTFWGEQECRKALPEGRVRLQGPTGGTGGAKKARRGRESLPESWERSVGPSGKPRGVGRPFQRTGQCRKALPEGWEG